VNKLFSASNKKTPAKKHPVVVVSGLPRSGTSMMMKMIVEGGLQPVMDGLRQADKDNPNGYFELEAVKEMAKGNPTWMDGAGGKVVKVISSLLEYLPPQHTYKIIFMEREMSEVLASQQKMLANRHEASTVADEELRQQFHDHLRTVKAWLVRQPNIEVLYINFETILADPESFCAGVADFIGLPLNVENMLSVPNKNLYRNRS
jgi:hypothetical protein